MSIFDYFKNKKKLPRYSLDPFSYERTVEAVTQRMFDMQEEYIKKENKHFNEIIEKNKEINNLRMENHALYKILESHHIRVDCKPIEEADGEKNE